MHTADPIVTVHHRIEQRVVAFGRSDAFAHFTELLISKQTEHEKPNNRFEKLLNMRMDGEITADVFISGSNEIRGKKARRLQVD